MNLVTSVVNANNKDKMVWFHYLWALEQGQTHVTMWQHIKIFPVQLQFDWGKHQRQRSCSGVRPSVSKSYNFFSDLKFCTNIIRGWIFLLSPSVQLAAGVSSPVTKFGGKLHTAKHQKDKKRQKIFHGPYSPILCSSWGLTDIEKLTNVSIVDLE